jgi:hypothetical protein
MLSSVLPYLPFLAVLAAAFSSSHRFQDQLILPLFFPGVLKFPKPPADFARR